MELKEAHAHRLVVPPCTWPGVVVWKTAENPGAALTGVAPLFGRGPTNREAARRQPGDRRTHVFLCSLFSVRCEENTEGIVGDRTAFQARAQLGTVTWGPNKGWNGDDVFLKERIRFMRPRCFQTDAEKYEF